VGAEIVENHDVAGTQLRDEDVDDVLVEDFAVGGRVNGHAGGTAVAVAAFQVPFCPTCGRTASAIFPLWPFSCLEDQVLRELQHLVSQLRKNRTLDWQYRNDARAHMRMLVIRLLKKYKYPPEGLDAAMETVLKQCEVWTDNAP